MAIILEKTIIRQKKGQLFKQFWTVIKSLKMEKENEILLS